MEHIHRQKQERSTLKNINLSNKVGTGRTDSEKSLTGPGHEQAAQLQRFINNSPHIAAQRKQQEELFGSAVQRKNTEEEEVVQGKELNADAQQEASLQKQENHTGLPDALKTGVENLSGYTMDDVKVHYNSARPAQLQAHAYAQGSDIHVGVGQEKHLPHEAWHVVQQKQGRVKPTMQMKGKVNINDDEGLEKEADAMGAKALAGGSQVSWQKARADAQPVIGQLSKDGPIQRAVGFEFEIDTVHTYSKNLLKQEKVLNKKDVLVTAPGFKVEADEMPGHSNLEFVTDAFPETADGGDRLKTAVNGISTIVANLTGQTNNEIAASALGVGTATANRFLRPTAGMLIGKPQVTAGIKLDMMSRMLEDMAYQAGHGNGNTNAKTFLGGQMAPNTGVRDVHSAGEGMLDVSQAIAATTNALQYVHGIVQQSDPSQPVIGGPELKALVTQLTLYLAQGAIGLQGYGKLIAGGLMSRTDFATIFNLLPRDKHDYFKDFPDMFVLLVLHAAKHAAAASGYQGAMSKSGPVFEGGLYLNNMMFGNNPAVPKGMPNLKREAWLLGIVGGTDQLTSVSFPGGKKEKEEIESLGSYGNKMDNLSANPGLYNTPAPLVELRGLKPLYAHLFPPMAFDLFRYIHIVNTGAQEDMPGHLMNLSAGDQGDIAQNNPNGIALRRQAVKDAMDEIEWW